MQLTMAQSAGMKTRYLVFFDYSKTFDSVPHRPLLCKLQHYGVHPQLLKWLANYLIKEINQYVCVNAVCDTLTVSSGSTSGFCTWTYVA